MKKRDFYCPACGEDTPQLHEGYCLDCLRDRQFLLDEHEFRQARWNAMTDRQRDAEIKNAIRRAS